MKFLVLQPFRQKVEEKAATILYQLNAKSAGTYLKVQNSKTTTSYHKSLRKYNTYTVNNSVISLKFCFFNGIMIIVTMDLFVIPLKLIAYVFYPSAVWNV